MMQMRAVIKAHYKGPYFALESLIVDMDFYMPIPKVTSKKNRIKMLSGAIRPARIPDLTNLRKFYEDLLQTVVYENDSKIVGGRSDKWYGDNPRVVVKVQEASGLLNMTR